MINRIVLNGVLSLALFGALSACVAAQTLTVRDIMAEPSIAGMRAEGEKLSPDGEKVVYLWNAEGKLPRDLYLSSANGGGTKIILRTGDLPVPSRTPDKENKLDYGLVLRDDFVKGRENQLGNFEWSPDSKQLIFSYGGDLYLFGFGKLPEMTSSEQLSRAWANYEKVLVRRADLAPKLVEAVQLSQIVEREIYGQVAEARSRLLSASLDNSGSPAGTVSATHVTAVLDANVLLDAALQRLLSLRENYPQLGSNETFQNAQLELEGAANRINVARFDFNNANSEYGVRRLTRTQAAESAPRFLDEDRIIYSQNGNLFVWDLKSNLITQISKEANPQAFVTVTNATPNKEGSLVAYVVSDSSKFKSLVVPNYLDEFVQASSVRRGWSEQKILVVPADGSRDTPFEIKLPKPEGVSNFRRIVWAADGRSLIADRVDKGTKRRQLFYIHNVGAKDEQTILVTEETDDKWQASLSSIVEPNPENADELFLGSERDGFNHLYLAKLEKNPLPQTTPGVITGGNPTDAGYSQNVKIEQLTKGSWQVEWAKWAPDGNEVIYLSTADGTASRQFSSIYMLNRRTSPVEGHPENGMRASPQMNTDGPPNLLYEISTWKSPGELNVVRVCPRCRGMQFPRKLTNTTPEAFTRLRWNEPRFEEIASRDGKKIPAKIYLPANFDKNRKYPMVVFVHGAGYLQNVVNGWNNYYREFMFNELLTQKGYVVLDIDYRGSAGYGRDWRTDVYDFLGGKDMDDHVDAIDYMVKNYAVNPDKIGVYGGSYGGFMAEMLAMRAPDKVAAAAALRPVADWKNYYASSPGYTAQRLGFPDKNPEAYRRSSPITYADQLKRPLLILHGEADDNVHVQDSMQLVEKLIRLGKTQYFEVMFYPSENHGFVRPESWTDEYQRILSFFEKQLK
ncbi:MAG: alpha/beta fold hydrolase [Acidobacteriota bacterium]